MKPLRRVPLVRRQSIWQTVCQMELLSADISIRFPPVSRYLLPALFIIFKENVPFPYRTGLPASFLLPDIPVQKCQTRFGLPAVLKLLLPPAYAL